MRRFTLILLLSSLFLALLAGCAGGKAESAAAVEAYLSALVNGQADQLATLSCADWESSAQTELDAFQNVAAQLGDLACSETGKDGDVTLVKCSGKITASYNGELQDFPLGDREYQLVREGGELRVCGYR